MFIRYVRPKGCWNDLSDNQVKANYERWAVTEMLSSEKL